MLTYFTFLLLFTGLPLLIWSLYYIRKYQNGDESQKTIIRNILIVLAILTPVAVIYTTPWDNFLVQNNIWYYQSPQVLGIIIGFVPIEEYAFFVLQTLFTGLLFGWIQLHRKEIRFNQNNLRINLNLISAGILVITWFIAYITFISKIETLTYLNLILLWGIPPILIQLIYGADILWLSRRDLFLIITFSTFYLAIADAIAIADGIWKISINTSTGILLAGILPIEEFVFFLITNILITFGLTLMIDSRSIDRLQRFSSRLKEISSRTQVER
ncbi:MAG: lycopene cyclase domain-containing protein [Candidatus Hodarchaeales archaeon]